jgi:hypothetical protein
MDTEIYWNFFNGHCWWTNRPTAAKQYALSSLKGGIKRRKTPLSSPGKI